MELEDTGGALCIASYCDYHFVCKLHDSWQLILFDHTKLWSDPVPKIHCVCNTPATSAHNADV